VTFGDREKRVTFLGPAVKFGEAHCGVIFAQLAVDVGALAVAAAKKTEIDGPHDPCGKIKVARHDAASSPTPKLFVAWKLIATGMSPNVRFGEDVAISKHAAPSMTTAIPVSSRNAFHAAWSTARPKAPTGMTRPTRSSACSVNKRAGSSTKSSGSTSANWTR